eukprot:scaffold35241_cov22-Tisochrysis_lutea.AAC.2
MSREGPSGSATAADERVDATALALTNPESMLACSSASVRKILTSRARRSASRDVASASRTAAAAREESATLAASTSSRRAARS